MDIRIPEVGESVREALLARWFKKSGDRVSKDEAICEIETDKITLDLHAEASGVLTVMAVEGTTLPVGAVIATIDGQSSGRAETAAIPAQQPSRVGTRRSTGTSPSLRRQLREKGAEPASLFATDRRGAVPGGPFPGSGEPVVASTPLRPEPPTAASAPRSQPRATSAQVTEIVISGDADSEHTSRSSAGREERRPMSPIRRRIAEHLVAARQQTAMLTTFNEADLSSINRLRAEYRDHYRMLYGAPLGLMPFFVKACVEGLKAFPVVNASIDGDDLVYHNYYDIGVAIGAEKGLVVPILRDADRMRLFEIDQAIAAFVEKINSNQLAISDIDGGTFSISNGGVYGSMLSTPIINIPQSGILGMHAIQERPVVRDGQVVIRPMMYLALSYDHRIIDGREAVGFLMKVRAVIESPREFIPELQDGR